MTRDFARIDFIGNWERHYGIFEGCGSSLPFDVPAEPDSSGGGCC